MKSMLHCSLAPCADPGDAHATAPAATSAVDNERYELRHIRRSLHARNSRTPNGLRAERSLIVAEHHRDVVEAELTSSTIPQPRTSRISSAATEPADRVSRILA
jgi:hypothetical protein